MNKAQVFQPLGCPGHWKFLLSPKTQELKCVFFFHGWIHFQEECGGTVYCDATAGWRTTKQPIVSSLLLPSQVNVFIPQPQTYQRLLYWWPLGLEPLEPIRPRSLHAHTWFLIRPLKTSVLHLSLVNMQTSWFVCLTWQQGRRRRRRTEGRNKEHTNMGIFSHIHSLYSMWEFVQRHQALHCIQCNILAQTYKVCCLTKNVTSCKWQLRQLSQSQSNLIIVARLAWKGIVSVQKWKGVNQQYKKALK